MTLSIKIQQTVSVQLCVLSACCTGPGKVLLGMACSSNGVPIILASMASLDTEKGQLGAERKLKGGRALFGEVHNVFAVRVLEH